MITALYLVRLKSHPMLSLKSDKITLRALSHSPTSALGWGAQRGSSPGPCCACSSTASLVPSPSPRGPIGVWDPWGWGCPAVGDTKPSWVFTAPASAHPTPSSAFYNHGLGFSIVSPLASGLLVLLPSLFFSSTCKPVVCISSP